MVLPDLSLQLTTSFDHAPTCRSATPRPADGRPMIEWDLVLENRLGKDDAMPAHLPKPLDWARTAALRAHAGGEPVFVKATPNLKLFVDLSVIRGAWGRQLLLDDQPATLRMVKLTATKNNLVIEQRLRVQTDPEVCIQLCCGNDVQLAVRHDKGEMFPRPTEPRLTDADLTSDDEGAQGGLYPQDGDKVNAGDEARLPPEAGTDSEE